VVSDLDAVLVGNLGVLSWSKLDDRVWSLLFGDKASVLVLEVMVELKVCVALLVNVRVMSIDLVPVRL
jgi:hypothetical protein